ncbi:hypothetical protein [Salmonella enterica]|nr:hypothetical protein [Salmonella enterica]
MLIYISTTPAAHSSLPQGYFIAREFVGNDYRTPVADLWLLCGVSAS